MERESRGMGGGGGGITVYKLKNLSFSVHSNLFLITSKGSIIIMINYYTNLKINKTKSLEKKERSICPPSTPPRNKMSKTILHSRLQAAAGLRGSPSRLMAHLCPPPSLTPQTPQHTWCQQACSSSRISCWPVWPSSDWAGAASTQEGHPG